MECSVCGGPLMILGILGLKRHLRCRNCGIESSQDIDPGDEVDNE